MWIRCCLILHNLIVEIEETLGLTNSSMGFYEQSTRHTSGSQEESNAEDEENEEDGEGDQTYIGTEGQDFHNRLMTRLLRALVRDAQ
jgi:hypothetical protein